jgi:hypothetical protein
MVQEAALRVIVENERAELLVVEYVVMGQE